MMKKTICLLLVLTLVFLCAACGGGSADSAGDIDVDLTKLSSTMVYSEVYNMMADPASYEGKVVKMAGTLTIYEGEDQNYYACLIEDATACCAQGIEFEWAGEHSASDYPLFGAPITVTGVFQTYVEDGYTYCHLVDAQMKT